VTGVQTCALPISSALSVNYEDVHSRRTFHLMNADQIGALSNKGIDFQLHTHRHRSPTDKALFVKEVQDNRRWIDDITGRHPIHFCYPSGNHQPAFLPWLKEEGVISATTCVGGLATPDTNALLLPRFLDHSGLTNLEYESWLTGVGSYCSRN